MVCFFFLFVYFHASFLRNLGSENSRVGNEEAIRSSLQGCRQSPEAFWEPVRPVTRALPGFMEKGWIALPLIRVSGTSGPGISMGAGPKLKKKC